MQSFRLILQIDKLQNNKISQGNTTNITIIQGAKKLKN